MIDTARQDSRACDGMYVCKYRFCVNSSRVAFCLYIHACILLVYMNVHTRIWNAHTYPFTFQAARAAGRYIPQTYICICIYTCIDNIYISFISLSPFIVCMGGYVVVCHTKGGPYGHDVT